jgi:RNA polymerase sigma-70 factor (ECF subfamily)
MFPETRWSLLAAATLHGDPAGREALESLCRTYWPAVERFLLSRGWSPQDAEDLTQEFFAAILPSRVWQRADRTRGKFRNFLLGVLMRVLSRHQRRGQAARRGAGITTLELDALAAAGIEFSAPDGEVQSAFDQAWAERILESAMESLSGAWPANHPDELLLLQRFLPGGDDPPAYEAAATALGCTPSSFKSRLFRFRQRFRELIEQNVALTISAPHELNAEIAWLEKVLSHPGFEPRESIQAGLK